MDSMQRIEKIGTYQGSKVYNDGLFYYICVSGRRLVIKEGYINYYSNKK